MFSAVKGGGGISILELSTEKGEFLEHPMISANNEKRKAGSWDPAFLILRC